ncbi:hypothetical protein [Streptomyces sp. NPDC029526]|uniref:hypothetical protein n=1 Tax=Streptomyces sp. NPDC029526 TaxID=3155728 RepID=UPI0033CCA8BE
MTAHDRFRAEAPADARDAGQVTGSLASTGLSTAPEAKAFHGPPRPEAGVS